MFVWPPSATVTVGLPLLIEQMKGLDADTPKDVLLRKVLDLGWHYMDLADEKKIFAHSVCYISHFLLI